jgi:RNA 3'-terminal phosphate cyclase (ATP)
MIDIDGSRGEGGGQILRTSLALAIITGKPFHMRNVRAGRAKPGLRRQHLTCVQAAAALCKATLRGATVGSQDLEFTPTAAVEGGEHTFDIGTAGSTTLVVQTVLVPAIVRPGFAGPRSTPEGSAESITAARDLRVRVIGGTHNPMAPPFDFLDRVFVPHLRAMGADVRLELERYGFAAGSPDPRAHYDAPSQNRGSLVLVTGAASALRPLTIADAGPITSRHAVSILARLPTHVAERELGVVRDRLGFTHAECEVREVQGGGPANLVMIEVERASGRELVTVHGEKGLRAEVVAERACAELAAFLDADVPVGEHLADQLLLPMAVAGGGSFRAAPLSLHATTNADTIGLFLDVPIRVEPDGAAVRVTIGHG